MLALSPIHCCRLGSEVRGRPCCTGSTVTPTCTPTCMPTNDPAAPTFGAILLTIWEMLTVPADCFPGLRPADRTCSSELPLHPSSSRCDGSPGRRGAGEAPSQTMSCWKSESLTGDSALEADAGLGLGIRVGVLNSGRSSARPVRKGGC